MKKSYPSRGFSLVELLIVIAIIGILITLTLVVVGNSRAKARDTHIRSSVGQLRTLAEAIYDSQGANYTGWSQVPSYQAKMNLLLNDIDSNYGDVPGLPYVAVLRDSQSKNFCISAPLSNSADTYYCVDATGEFLETSEHCPDEPADGAPLRCP